MRIRSISNDTSVALNGNHSYLAAGAAAMDAGAAAGSCLRRRPRRRSAGPLFPVSPAKPADSRGLRCVADFSDELLDDILQEQHPAGVPVRSDNAREM